MHNLDLLSPSPKLFSNGESRYSSNLGGFLTLSTFGIAVFLTVFFGWDLFVRESPEVSSSKVINESPLVDQDDFFFSTSIQYTGGLPIKEIERKLEFGVQLVETDNTKEEQDQTIILAFKMEPCHETAFFKENRNNITSVTIGARENYFCPPDNLKYKLRGVFGSNSFSAVSFNVSLCKSSEDCYSEDFIQGNLTGIFFHTIFKDFYVDSFDFGHPIKDNLETILTPVSASLKQDFNVFFQEFDFADEQGWIFPQNTLATRHSLDYYTTGLDNIGPNRDIVRLITSFNNFKQVYRRRYQKLQEALAQATGTMRVFTVAFKMILSLYSYYSANRRRMRLYLKEAPKRQENELNSNENSSVITIKRETNLENPSKAGLLSSFARIYESILSEENLFELCALHEVNSKRTKLKNRVEIAKLLQTNVYT